MSLEKWKVQELELLSQSLILAGERIAKTTAEMRKANYLELVLQARAAMTVYRPNLVRLAGTIDSEFRDQYGCSVTGGVPSWQMNQKKVEARKAKETAVTADKSKRRGGIHSATGSLGEKEREKRPSKKR